MMVNQKAEYTVRDASHDGWMLSMRAKYSADMRHTVARVKAIAAGKPMDWDVGTPRDWAIELLNEWADEDCARFEGYD